MYSLIYTTTKDIEEARAIQDMLLKKKLAVCVSIIPFVESSYWWKGQIEKSKEAMIFAKTKDNLVDAIIKAIKKSHSYNVPTILSLKIDETNKEFSDWLETILK